MAMHNSLDVAKREMLSSINQLLLMPVSGDFYSLETRILSDPLGRKGLMAATANNKARVRTQLESISPLGGTDHMLALASSS